jgi:glycosyltransferase involved in cell wall biosynthesis
VDVSIVICTFGDRTWQRLARERALPSAEAQGVPVGVFHAETLADARNEALADCDTPWIIFVDADDEIEPGYCEAMLAGHGDVRAPSVRRVKPDGRAKRRTYMPRVYNHSHVCRGDCLPLGNWCCCGSMARVDLLKEAGGWWDEDIYEDWSLWLRCWKVGGDIQPCFDAVYRYWESPNNRNGSLPPAERDEWHWKIHDSIMSRSEFSADAA